MKLRRKSDRKFGIPRPKNKLPGKTNGFESWIWDRAGRELQSSCNVRIIGLPEEATTEGNGTFGESQQTSLRKVVDIANIIGASLTPNYISIAHRMPYRVGKAKPIIVKFVRWIRKINHYNTRMS